MRLSVHLAISAYFRYPLAMVITSVAMTMCARTTSTTLDAQPPVESVADGVVFVTTEWHTPHDVVAHSDKYGLTGSMVEIRDGVELFVIEEGDSIPVVLLNGGPGNSLQSFIPGFSRAADFARVIYYDPRGVGRSSWNAGADGYSTPQAIADLDALRESLGIDRWVVLGWSWGGLLAQRYALEHPDRLLGMVLLSSTESMGSEKDNDIYVNHLSSQEQERQREIYRVDGQNVVPLTSDALSVEKVRELLYNSYLNGGWKRQYYYKPDAERMNHISQHEWLHDVDYNPRMRNTGFDRDLTPQEWLCGS